ALSVVLWVAIECLFFRLANVMTSDKCRLCQIFVRGKYEPNLTLVKHRNFDVTLIGRIPPGGGGFRFLIQDTVPDTFSLFNGRAMMIVDGKGGERFEMKYSIRTAICVKADLPGLRIEISYHRGYFKTEQFVPVHQEAMVLPFLIRPHTTVSILKHNNLQQHIGHHRNLTSGVSSELMGIRNYRPGDPPRTIAWKPTARLGKLMTCEYESEVPIRSTLLVDLAAYQFQGRPGPTAADRAITTCASVARLLLADRDPVGAILVTSAQPFLIKHGSGERQLSKLLQYLMAGSNPNPPLHKFSIELLVEVVFDNASRRFPGLFNEFYNRIPTRRSWIRFDKTRGNRIRAGLALALEQLLNLQPGLAVRMQFDDFEMGNACLQYVDRYSVVGDSTTVALNVPGYDPTKWRFERQRITQVICEQLNQARARAKDKELFVVICPEPVDQIGHTMLENAIRNLIASNHRIIFVAPQPPRLGQAIGDPVAARIVTSADKTDPRNADSEFRNMVNSLGGAFSRIDNPGLMQLVAMEVGLLQSAASRGRGMRSGR
ncbi:MAG: DUF58 domain-containing protein, partial [Planctomycetota bacterium]